MPDPEVTSTGAPGLFVRGPERRQVETPAVLPGALDPGMTPHLLALVSRVNALEGAQGGTRQELLRVRGELDLAKSKAGQAANLIEAWFRRNIADDFQTDPQHVDFKQGLEIIRSI